MSWKCQPPACASFTPFSGNMDLMVSQVRRSVVSVVQQYSHIRYLRLLVDPLSPGLMYYIKMSSLNFPSDHTCKKKKQKKTLSLFLMKSCWFLPQWSVPVWPLCWGSSGCDGSLHWLVAVHCHPSDQRWGLSCELSDICGRAWPDYE